MIAWLPDQSKKDSDRRIIFIAWSMSVRGLCHVHQYTYTGLNLWASFIIVSEVPVRSNTPTELKTILYKLALRKLMQGPPWVWCILVSCFSSNLLCRNCVWDVAPIKHIIHIIHSDKGAESVILVPLDTFTSRMCCRHLLKTWSCSFASSSLSVHAAQMGWWWPWSVLINWSMSGNLSTASSVFWIRPEQ